MKVILVIIPGVPNPHVYSNRRKAIEACLTDAPFGSYAYCGMEEKVMPFNTGNIANVIHKLGHDEYMTVWSSDDAEPIFELLLEEVR